MSFTKEKPSFSKEYANRVSKADFIDHFTKPEPVYPTLTVDELGVAWDGLQEPKTEDKPGKKQPTTT